MAISRRGATIACADANIPPTVLGSSVRPVAPKRDPHWVPRVSRHFRKVRLVRRVKSSVCCTALNSKAVWREYCHSTAIHGVRYFVKEGTTRLEKTFWVLSLALSLSACFYLMSNVYSKWDKSPPIATFAETSTPIWQVPFPAVTICPQTKVRRRIFSVTDMFLRAMKHRDNKTGYENEFNEIEKNMLDVVSLVCQRSPGSPLIENGNLTISEDALNDVLTAVVPPIHETFLGCMWKGNLVANCTSPSGDNNFSPVMTDEGLCYTFNMLSGNQMFTQDAVQHDRNPGTRSADWDLDGGYPEDAPLDTFPRRALRNGVRSGIIIIMSGFTLDSDSICQGPLRGFKVLLHSPAEPAWFDQYNTRVPSLGNAEIEPPPPNPLFSSEVVLHKRAEVPQSGQQHFYVPFNRDVEALVKPFRTTIAKNLREYYPDKRKCYLPKERPLRYFQVYTQKNCDLECYTNYTLNVCNCTDFYMPRSLGDPICGPGSIRCMQSARESLARIEVQRTQKKEIHTVDCHCLPACTSLEYDAQVSVADYEWQDAFEAHNTSLDELGKGLTISRLAIYYKDTHFITSHKGELYGSVDFIANCGGLLGLFSGFSIISLIEILYFLSIRLWCSVIRAYRANQRRVEVPAELTSESHHQNHQRIPRRLAATTPPSIAVAQINTEKTV